jgi:hypothetical protein
VTHQLIDQRQRFLILQPDNGFHPHRVEDGRFDAVVSVFSIFFVPDMEGLSRSQSGRAVFMLDHDQSPMVACNMV